jgi:predicted  nucleic acid-binding Zn-ribbon protein
MTTFSGYHIQQFNQKCRSLVGEGKVLMSHKELRDLNSEIMELLLSLRTAESNITDLKTKVTQTEEITIELQGGNF